MILHFLQDGIRLKVEFVRYDPIPTCVLWGRLEGPRSGCMVSGFVSVLDCSLFCPPYIYVL